MQGSNTNILPQLLVKQRTKSSHKKSQRGSNPKVADSSAEGGRKSERGKGLLLAWPTGDLKR